MLVNRGKVLKNILIFMYLLIAAMSLGVIVQCILLLDLLPHISTVVAEGIGVRFLVSKCVKIAFNIIIILVFISFAWTLVRRQTVFLRGQSVRLVIIGFVLLIDFAASIATPRYAPPSGALFKMDSTMPLIDYRLLSFALMFFALAAVFEYGRFLQEDSDDII